MFKLKYWYFKDTHLLLFIMVSQVFFNSFDSQIFIHSVYCFSSHKSNLKKTNIYTRTLKYIDSNTLIWANWFKWNKYYNDTSSVLLYKMEIEIIQFWWNWPLLVTSQETSKSSRSSTGSSSSSQAGSTPVRDVMESERDRGILQFLGVQQTSLLGRSSA